MGGSVVKRDTSVAPRENNVSGECTYNPPTAKMEIRAIFCRRPRFKPRMTGIGRMIMAKSVTMLIPALVLQQRSVP
jgi:hypothetical protein